MAREQQSCGSVNSAGQPVLSVHTTAVRWGQLDPDFRSLESDGDSQPAGDAGNYLISGSRYFDDFTSLTLPTGWTSMPPPAPLPD